MIGSSGRRLIAAVIGRSPRADQPSTLYTFIYRSRGWHRLSPARLKVNRGARVDLVSGNQTCLLAPNRQVVRAWCLHGSRWQQVGTAVFHTTAPSPVTGYDGATGGLGRTPVVLQAHLQGARQSAGAAGVGGRLQHFAYAFNHGRWHRAAATALDSTASGTQRPFGFRFHGHICFAYDRLANDPATPPEIRASCLRGGTWVDAGVPPLRIQDLPTSLRDQPAASVDVDGAEVADGRLFIGTDVFYGDHGTWLVWKLTDDGWKLTPLGAPANESWNSQGELYALAGQPWTVRFDQQQTRQGLKARLVVAHLNRGTTSIAVAPELFATATLQAPLYWGLVRVDGQTYGMAAVAGRRRSTRLVIRRLVAVQARAGA